MTQRKENQTAGTGAERLSRAAIEALREQEGFAGLRGLLGNLDWEPKDLDFRLGQLAEGASKIGSISEKVAQASLGKFLGGFAGGGEPYKELTAGLEENNLDDRLARVLVAGSGIAEKRDFFQKAAFLGGLLETVLSEVEVGSGQAPCLERDQTGEFATPRSVVGLVLDTFQKKEEESAVEPVDRESLLAARVVRRFMSEAGLKTTPEELVQLASEGLASRRGEVRTVEEGQVRNAAIEALMKGLVGGMSKGRSFKDALMDYADNMPRSVRDAVGDFLSEFDRERVEGKRKDKALPTEREAVSVKLGEDSRAPEEKAPVVEQKDSQEEPALTVKGLSQEEIEKIQAGEEFEPIKLKGENGEISQAAFLEEFPDAKKALEGLKFKISILGGQGINIIIRQGELSVIDLKEEISIRLFPEVLFNEHFLNRKGEQYLQIKDLPLLRFDGRIGDDEVIFTPVIPRKGAPGEIEEAIVSAEREGEDEKGRRKPSLEAAHQALTEDY